MRVKLWGTRGAIPSPEPANLGYGGNTCCVEVEAGDGGRLILDGGIGAHSLGKEMLRADFGRGQGEAHMLLARSQWDHIQGIPFFIPLLIEGNRFTVCGRGGRGTTLARTLEAQMERAYCPVPNFLRPEIGADLEIKELGASGEFAVGGTRVLYRRAGGGPFEDGLGFRLEADGAALAYLPSVEYADDADRQNALELADGADLLLHDAYYSPAEHESRRGKGHASDADAVHLARESGARRLRFFHYHPDHDDAFIDARVAAYRDSGLDVAGAREGEELVLGDI